MTESKSNKRIEVCLLASHPLALREMRRALVSEAYNVEACVLALSPAGLASGIPPAEIYVVDIEGVLSQVAPVLDELIREQSSSLFIATAEVFNEANTFPVLRLGVKGIVEHDALERQLPQAIETVAAGGYWVPRIILSDFVSSILKTQPHPRMERKAVDLSKREVEALDGLLENLSNKEIGTRLGISERTVKFHVSNVMRKFRVRRRADLILLGVQTNNHAQNVN